MSSSDYIVGAVEPADIGEITAPWPDRHRAALEDAQAVLTAGAFVRRLREKTGLDQKAFAERSGLAQEQISDLERAAGRKGPTIATLARAARAAGEELTLVTSNELEELRAKAARANAGRARNPASGSPVTRRRP